MVNPIEAAIQAQQKKKAKQLQEELGGEHGAHMATEMESAHKSRSSRRSKERREKKEKKEKKRKHQEAAMSYEAGEERTLDSGYTYEETVHESAFMADGDAPPAAEAAAEEAPAEEAPAEEAAAEEAPAEPVSDGDVNGDGAPDLVEDEPDTPEEIAADKLRYKKKCELRGKKGIATRVKTFGVCNMFADAAQVMLNYALDNPMEKGSVLNRRAEILSSLYFLRYTADTEDAFTLQDFEADMANIKRFRGKMQRLAAKEDVDNQESDQEASSDDDDEDDIKLLGTLKDARKAMQYAFGATAGEVQKGLDDE